MNVKIAPMCIFLFRDGKHENHSPITVAEKLCLGTVITIHQDTKLNLTAPITGRLRQRDTGLRSTADASLLVESLLDLGTYASICLGRRQCSWSLGGQADETLHPRLISGRSGTRGRRGVPEQDPQARAGCTVEAEREARPSSCVTPSDHAKSVLLTLPLVHILQGDLILHKRTLEPIKTVIYGLRRYDVDRVAALMEKLDPDKKVQGYMSHKAKIYLADVHDHMEYILSSLDMFAGISDNLINYTFNVRGSDVLRQETSLIVACRCLRTR